MVLVPAARPVTVTGIAVEELMVAISGEPTSHVPPVTPSLSEVVPETQTSRLPEIGPGKEFTLTVCVS
jgi:hypothetical protein